jgi:hypothetical protein
MNERYGSNINRQQSKTKKSSIERIRQSGTFGFTYRRIAQSREVRPQIE